MLEISPYPGLSCGKMIDRILQKIAATGKEKDHEKCSNPTEEARASARQRSKRFLGRRRSRTLYLAPRRARRKINGGIEIRPSLLSERGQCHRGWFQSSGGICEKTLGGCDVLVNNAAIFIGGAVHNTSIEDFDKVFNVDVRGVFLLCKAFLPEMMERGSRISLISLPWRDWAALTI